MVKTVDEYLVQHPEVVDHVKEGKANLIGLSGTEQQAVLDVFSREKNNKIMAYWQ